MAHLRNRSKVDHGHHFAANAVAAALTVSAFLAGVGILSDMGATFCVSVLGFQAFWVGGYGHLVGRCWTLCCDSGIWML